MPFLGDGQSYIAIKEGGSIRIHHIYLVASQFHRSWLHIWEDEGSMDCRWLRWVYPTHLLIQPYHKSLFGDWHPNHYLLIHTPIPPMFPPFISWGRGLTFRKKEKKNEKSNWRDTAKFPIFNIRCVMCEDAQNLLG